MVEADKNASVAQLIIGREEFERLRGVYAGNANLRELDLLMDVQAGIIDKLSDGHVEICANVKDGGLVEVTLNGEPAQLIDGHEIKPFALRYIITTLCQPCRILDGSAHIVVKKFESGEPVRIVVGD